MQSMAAAAGRKFARPQEYRHATCYADLGADLPWWSGAVWGGCEYTLYDEHWGLARGLGTLLRRIREWNCFAFHYAAVQEDVGNGVPVFGCLCSQPVEEAVSSVEGRSAPSALGKAGDDGRLGWGVNREGTGHLTRQNWHGNAGDCRCYCWKAVLKEVSKTELSSKLDMKKWKLHKICRYTTEILASVLMTAETIISTSLIRRLERRKAGPEVARVADWTRATEKTYFGRAR